MEKMISSVAKSPPARTRLTPLWIMALAGGLMFCITVLAGTARAADRPDSFADLAERLSPAVVNISTSMVIKGGDGPSLPRFPKAPPLKIFSKSSKIEASLGAHNLLALVL